MCVVFAADDCSSEHVLIIISSFFDAILVLCNREGRFLLHGGMAGPGNTVNSLAGAGLL